MTVIHKPILAVACPSYSESRDLLKQGGLRLPHHKKGLVSERDASLYRVVRCLASITVKFP